jgi:hypothetical protein
MVTLRASCPHSKPSLINKTIQALSIGIEDFPDEIAAKEGECGCDECCQWRRRTQLRAEPAIAAATAAKRDISIQWGLYRTVTEQHGILLQMLIRYGTEFMGLVSGSSRSSIYLSLLFTLYATCCASRTWCPRTHAYILQAVFHPRSCTTSHSKHRTPHPTLPYERRTAAKHG